MSPAPLSVRWPALPPLLTTLPGSGQRRRCLRLLALSGLVMLLRPWPPLVLLPGWLVGVLLLLTAVELVLVLWRPRRWR